MPSLPTPPATALTPRQQFAVTLLAAMISKNYKFELGVRGQEEVIDTAVDLADALLARLERRAR